MGLSTLGEHEKAVSEKFRVPRPTRKYEQKGRTPNSGKFPVQEGFAEAGLEAEPQGHHLPREPLPVSARTSAPERLGAGPRQLPALVFPGPSSLWSLTQEVLGKEDPARAALDGDR